MERPATCVIYRGLATQHQSGSLRDKFPHVMPGRVIVDVGDRRELFEVVTCMPEAHWDRLFNLLTWTKVDSVGHIRNAKRGYGNGSAGNV